MQMQTSANRTRTLCAATVLTVIRLNETEFVDYLHPELSVKVKERFVAAFMAETDTNKDKVCIVLHYILKKTVQNAVILYCYYYFIG